MTDDNPSVARRFIYAGKRLTTKGTLIPAWLPEDEPDLMRLFPKAKGTVIGGVYTIEVSDSTYVPGSVSYTGDRAERDVVLALEAEDRADGVVHSQKTLERNDARTSELKELCAPLRAIVGKQVGWANRTALLAYITSEISRG